MKKKILAICLVVALVAILAVGNTLAYLTDKDQAENVMTLGRVDITQLEQERDASGNMVDFQQNKPLYPLVDLRTAGEEMFVDDLFNEKIKNVVDKFISVHNNGTRACYVRTIIAFESVRSYEPGSSTVYTDLHDHFFLVKSGKSDVSGESYRLEYLDQYIELNGTEYVLAVCTYEKALQPGETTPYSLKQFALTSEAGNEVADTWFGTDYTILALSQAVQVAGFESVGAEYALDTAFGEITEANAQSWFSEFVTIP